MLILLHYRRNYLRSKNDTTMQQDAEIQYTQQQIEINFDNKNAIFLMLKHNFAVESYRMSVRTCAVLTADRIVLSFLSFILSGKSRG
jgi:hypothetical protein